jgi:hypothetical protein
MVAHAPSSPVVRCRVLRSASTHPRSFHLRPTKLLLAAWATVHMPASAAFCIDLQRLSICPSTCIMLHTVARRHPNKPTRGRASRLMPDCSNSFLALRMEREGSRASYYKLHAVASPVGRQLRARRMHQPGESAGESWRLTRDKNNKGCHTGRLT